MSVNPGFGAQEFIPYSFEKIQNLRKIIDQKGLSVKIEVDGGIKLDNVCELVRKGAEIVVSGSAIFGSENPGEQVKAMIKRASKCYEI